MLPTQTYSTQQYLHLPSLPSTSADESFAHVSMDMVYRLVNSPNTGKSFSEAVKDDENNKTIAAFSECEKEDKCEEEFVNALKEMLCSRSEGDSLHFKVREKEDKYHYELSDDNENDLAGVKIKMFEESSSDEVIERKVYGVTLHALKEYFLQENPFNNMMKSSDGNAAAHYQEGLLYKDGTALLKNKDRAKEYIGAAAKQSPTLAQFYIDLADMEISVKEFKEYLPNCCVSFTPSVMWGLAVSLAHHFPKDLLVKMTQQAKKMSDMAHSCIQASFIDTWIKHYSDYVKTQGSGSIFDSQMRKLAKLNYAPALYTVGMMSWEQEAAALEFFKAAAREDYAPAQYELSRLLQRKGDKKGSWEWLGKAADQKYLPALTHIAQHQFKQLAANGGLYDDLRGRKIPLPLLPQEIAEHITSLNTSDPLTEDASETWFEYMVKLINWDRYGFNREKISLEKND